MLHSTPSYRIVGIAALATAVLLAGCTKEQMGQATGGALGGYLGSQVGGSTATQLAVTAAGALAGSLIGGSIGRTMDDVDRHRTGQALESAPTGTATHWQNPDTGADYTVTPTRTFETADGPCREYTTQVVIDGRSEQVIGTACRQADGSWAGRD